MKLAVDLKFEFALVITVDCKVAYLSSTDRLHGETAVMTDRVR